MSITILEAQFVLAQNGLKVTRPAICYRTTIYIDPMLSNFLRLPKSNLRKQNKAKSEIGSVKDQSEVDSAEPTLQTRRSLTPCNQESDGMQTTLSRTVHLSTPFRVKQTQVPFPGEAKPTSLDLQIVLLTQE